MTEFERLYKVGRCRLAVSSPVLKRLRFQRLKLESHKLLSTFAFNFNLRQHNKGMNMTPLNEAIIISAESILRNGYRQGLTLVHFSAQLEPCLTHKNTLHTLHTP